MATKEENEKIRAGFATFKERQAQDRGFTPSAISRQVKLVASANDVSVPKSALDNFLSTYKNVKFGPLQRAIAKFIDSLKSGTPAKPKSVTSTDTRTSPADRFKGLAKIQQKQENTQPVSKDNRAKSQGGRSREQVTEERQKRLAAKSAAQGGGSVLSKKRKTAKQAAASEDVGAVSGARPKKKPNLAAKKPAAKPSRKGPVQASSGKSKSKPASVGAISQEAAARKRIRDAAKKKKDIETRKGPVQASDAAKRRPKKPKPDQSRPRGGKVTAKRINPAMKERGKAFQGSYDPKTEVLRNVTVNGKRKTMVFPKKKKS